MGDLETDQLICRLFCAKLGVAVVNVDYRRYPEVRFGVPMLDCYDAVRWVAANAHSFGGAPSKGFIVSGNSGGGTFASITVHLARDDNLEPSLTGCFLTCPIFSDEGFDEEGKPNSKYDRETEYRSWWQNKDAPLMNDEMRRGIAEFVEYDWKSTLLTPFNFQSHRNIPPTYMTACGLILGEMESTSIRRSSRRMVVSQKLIHILDYPIAGGQAMLKFQQRWYG